MLFDSGKDFVDICFACIYLQRVELLYGIVLTLFLCNMHHTHQDTRNGVNAHQRKMIIVERKRFRMSFCSPHNLRYDFHTKRALRIGKDDYLMFGIFVPKKKVGIIIERDRHLWLELFAVILPALEIYQPRGNQAAIDKDNLRCRDIFVVMAELHIGQVGFPARMFRYFLDIQHLYACHFDRGIIDNKFFEIFCELFITHTGTKCYGCCYHAHR